MNVNLQEPSPLQAGPLGHFEARMLRSFRAAVEDWDEVCSSLGAWEAEHLTEDNAGPALAQHRVWVTELLTWGQRVQRVTGEPSFPDETLAARVEARLRHLRDKLALWHGEMTTTDEARILQLAFP